jgi:hypothetical protein
VATVRAFEPGGYRYIEGVFQYSGGVAVESGYAIERVRFGRPLPLGEGFAAVERYLATVGRPLQAFCACELRSPAPFTEAGFMAFNRAYVGTLERWEISRDDVNPVARTNVCPEIEPPAEVMLYAFSYTVPSVTSRPSFIVSGSGEAREGASTYRESIVRLGDVSTEGLREKIRFVMDVMEARLAALGTGWPDAVSAQVYTVHDIGPLVREELVERGAATGGLEWHFSRPPVQDLDFEMDVRGAAAERII